MKTEYTNIAGIPALVIGESSEQVCLFVHGKMGSKEEAVQFARLACPEGVQVVGIDLPGHGARTGSEDKLLPWAAVPEIQQVYRAMKERWTHVFVRANSIGAWFSMLALWNEDIRKAWFVSPVVDMEDLIQNMMAWSGVTEEELHRRGEIDTGFGEVLSWEYLSWVRGHPVRWSIPTQILYGGKDELTSRAVIEGFAAKSASGLTVMEEGEHWFHTEEQVRILNQWEKTQVLERFSQKTESGV